ELLHYGLEALPADGVVVAISQSGESAETLRVVEHLAPRHPVVAITNDPESRLGRRGQVLLPLCAGAEAAISTKTYSNTLALLHLLAAAVAGRDLEAECRRLEGLAADMTEALDRREAMDGAADFLRDAAFLYFLARGPALAAARQAALTFSEGARLPTCALAGGSFRHGPLELAGEGFAAAVLAPAGGTWELSTALAGQIAAAGGRVLLLTDRAPAARAGGLRIVDLPPCGEDLFPLAACVPVELLLYRMARDRGREAGVFQHISKVTRRE
ncbi:MAG: SIS domain-containing protein, partial [Gemmatimonadota bacterium]